jgi:hypothetical protein
MGNTCINDKHIAAQQVFRENKQLKDELEELRKEANKPPEPVSDTQPDVGHLQKLLQLSTIENEQRLKVL